MKIFFAPLQGYTDAAYRIFHNEIYPGCIDCYYTPFLRLEHGQPRKKDLLELEVKNPLIKVVPQIIAKDILEFRILVNVLRDIGHAEIDINMGCPFPLQVKKGRGAGLLSNPGNVFEILCEISNIQDISFSIKMRLGNADKTQWRAYCDSINATPLKHITIHPRIASQQYQGEVDMDIFDEIYNSIKHKIVYNGDITTVSQIVALEEKYPQLDGIMIGRGLLTRPSLAMEYKNGVEITIEQQIHELIILHNKLYGFYSSKLQGESHLLAKMKTFWDYSETIIGHKVFKQIKKSSSILKYNSVVNALSNF